MNNSRNNTLDIAKAFLIILMALGHTLLIIGLTEKSEVYGNLNTWIYSFHMPAFFIISGMLYNKSKWEQHTLCQFILAKFKQVIIPYFFFEIIAALMKRFFNWGTYDSFSDIILNILSVRCYLPADWFLIVYFYSSILFHILVNHLPKRTLAILSIVSILLIGWFHPGSTYLRLLRIIIAASCIAIGYTVKESFLKKRPAYNIIILFIINIAATYLNQKTVILSDALIHNPIYFLIGALSGTLGIIQLSQYIHSSWLSFIGRNTIIVLGFHSDINYMISYFTYLVPKFWFLMFMLIISFGLLTLIIPFSNRFFPKAVGKWK